MRTLPRLLLSATLLASSLTLAEPQAPARASKTIRVHFSGPLRDAVRQIAQAGGLNVMVSSDVSHQPVDVYLESIGAEEALRVLARTHGLQLAQEGSVFVVSSEGSAPPKAEPAAPLGAPPAPPPALPPLGAPPALPSLGAPPALPPQALEDVQRLADDASRLGEEAGREAARERLRDRLERLREAGKGAQDVVARGRSLEIGEDQVADSAVVYGGHLMIKGLVEDDAVAFGGNVNVVGHVEGDVTAFGGNVVLGPDSVVEGDVSAFGGHVTREPGAHVEGSIGSYGGETIASTVAKEVSKEVTRSLKEDALAEGDEDDDRGGGLAGFLLSFAALFGVGFAGQMFFPTRMKDLAAEVRAQPVRCGAVGLLGALALLPVTVVLCVTIIGIPVAMALLVAVPLTTALGFSAVASELGLRLPILRGRKTQAVVLALGLLLMLIISRIPVIGGVAMTLATLMAFGAVIRTRFGSRTRSFPEPFTPSTTAQSTL